MNIFFKVVFAFCLSLFLGWGIGCGVESIQFDRNCTGHLKRAADANTIELADKELSQAVDYLEHRNMTSGFTSVFYTTPDEDVGFWFSNLKASQLELRSINLSTASQLEKTNILMKLRETLLDNVGGGQTVTAPEGIAVFPYNAAMVALGLFSFVFMIVCAIGWSATSGKI